MYEAQRTIEVERKSQDPKSLGARAVDIGRQSECLANTVSVATRSDEVVPTPECPEIQQLGPFYDRAAK